ncbi:MAG TPA: hypothetical protein VIL30_22415, partial [Ramlibacter sp.]
RQFAKFTLDPQARKAVEWQLGSKVVGHEDDGVGIGLVVQMSDVRFEYLLIVAHRSPCKAQSIYARADLASAGVLSS